jgi:hypothetical protein
MSVRSAQLLEEDYIRATERFKTLWSFQQFLRGVHKTFFPADPRTTPDLSSLSEEIRSIGRRIQDEPSKAAAPRLKDLSQRLDRMTVELRQVDRNISPSFVRRFFEQVRPQSERTAFQLLRFYFSQPETDVDVIDKVNFLATVVAAGSSDPSAYAARPKNELRGLLEDVTASAVWPRPSDPEAFAIAYVVNELSAKLSRARTFGELTNRGPLDEFRAVKRKIGASLVHPEVLTAVVYGNLSTREAFSRLYRSEEKLLDEATARIGELERELRRGSGEVPLPEDLRRFRETREQLQRRALQPDVPPTDAARPVSPTGGVLRGLDLAVFEGPIDGRSAPGPQEEPTAPVDDEAFWKPLVGRILGAVEKHDDRGSLQTGRDELAQLRLERRELEIARRVMSAGGEARNDRDRTLLRAVSLRLRAEEQAELLRNTADEPRSREALTRARETIARAPELDAKISRIIDVAGEAKLSEQVRVWTRARLRLLRAIAELWLMQDQPQ